MIVEIYPQLITKDRDNWLNLLQTNSLRYEKTIDHCYGCFADGQLVGTASIFANIIKCVAIHPNYRGGAVFNELISFLLNSLAKQGQTKIFVYTKPAAVLAFQALGFREIAGVYDKLVLLERAKEGFGAYIASLKNAQPSLPDNAKIGAVVLNANPFTRGHLYLVETALQRVDFLHIFVVSQDRSAFPTAIRRQLVAAGTQHLQNVALHSTNDYIVSAATFPAYFLPEDEDLTRLQASLDATIFKKYIAPALNITYRFVGSEELSPKTDIYNQAMEQVFADDINLQVVPRLKNETAEIISASYVRQALKAGDYTKLESLLPPTSLDYLKSEPGRQMVAKIFQSGYEPSNIIR